MICSALGKLTSLHKLELALSANKITQFAVRSFNIRLWNLDLKEFSIDLKYSNFAALTPQQKPWRPGRRALPHGAHRQVGAANQARAELQVPSWS